MKIWQCAVSYLWPMKSAVVVSYFWPTTMAANLTVSYLWPVMLVISPSMNPLGPLNTAILKRMTLCVESLLPMKPTICW